MHVFNLKVSKYLVARRPLAILQVQQLPNVRIVQSVSEAQVKITVPACADNMDKCYMIQIGICEKVLYLVYFEEQIEFTENCTRSSSQHILP